MVLLVIIGLIMAIVAVLFALQNAALVTINFGIWELEQSLAVVLIGTLGLGIIISTLLSLPTIFKRGWQNSQQQQKIESLQRQLKAKNQETLEREQFGIFQQEALEEILRAFSLTDEVTGVLSKNTTVKLTEHLLQQLTLNPRYSSLVVMLIAIEPGKSSRSFADLGSQRLLRARLFQSRQSSKTTNWANALQTTEPALTVSENAVYKAIAKRLKNAIAVDSFLGITERRRFISLAFSLKGTAVNEYVTYLQNSVTESPLQKADGVLLPLKMTVGAVVVDPTDTVDGRQILKQAEHNVEKALVKGRGNLEISEVTQKSI